jgi:hypothetical protein
MALTTPTNLVGGLCFDVCFSQLEPEPPSRGAGKIKSSTALAWKLLGTFGNFLLQLPETPGNFLPRFEKWEISVASVKTAPPLSKEGRGKEDKNKTKKEKSRKTTRGNPSSFCSRNSNRQEGQKQAVFFNFLALGP